MKFSKYLKDKLVILAAYLIICGLANNTFKDI